MCCWVKTIRTLNAMTIHFSIYLVSSSFFFFYTMVSSSIGHYTKNQYGRKKTRMELNSVQIKWTYLRLVHSTHIHTNIREKKRTDCGYKCSYRVCVYVFVLYVFENLIVSFFLVPFRSNFNLYLL